MSNFPEIMIIRYYDGGEIGITYSDDGSKVNKDLLYQMIDREYEENKHLERAELVIKGENIFREGEKNETNI